MGIQFDPRTKFFMLLISPVILALDFNLTMEIVITLIYIAPFFLSKEIQWGVGFLLVYIAQLAAAFYVVPVVDNYFVLYALSLVANGFRRMMPSIISGAYAIKTTDISEWLSMFKQWRFPNAFIVPFAVMARFFPTVREDYRHIRQAMAFRGIGTGASGMLRNPIRSFEFILIPLLMNASQVAQDLTISALTKGLGIPGKHTSLVELNRTVADWLMMAVVLIPVVLYIGGNIS